LAPTRELAAQINESFKKYGEYLHFKRLEVYGGVGIYPQIRSLQRGVDVLIATPGRLLDLMNQRKVNLNDVEFLVLDEADRMLDMGFLEDVRRIISSLPKKRQSLFFSATMSKGIIDLTRNFLDNPKKVEITPESTPVEKIKQLVYFVDHPNKNELLLDLISQEKITRALVFVKAKHRADKVARMLHENEIYADALHGDKSQAQRARTLRNFKQGKTQILVATDIAARGIDVNDISHVINFDLPNEPENYVHRVGRTARAGKEGVAYSFCAAEDRNFLHEIERAIKKNTPHAEHRYHSDIAKNAQGAEARPRPRGRGNSRGGRGGSSDSRRRFDGRRSNSGGSRGSRRSEGSGDRSEGRRRFSGRRPEGRRNNSRRSAPRDERSDRRGRSGRSSGRNRR